MFKSIIVFVACIIIGVTVDVLGSQIGLHYGSIVAIAFVGAFIINKLEKGSGDN